MHLCIYLELGLVDKERLSALDLSLGTLDHLANDLLGTEHFLQVGGHISHKPRATWHRDLGALGELDFMWEFSLRSERLDLILTTFPLLDVVGAADTKGTASVNKGGGSVSVVGGDDELLVLGGSTGLLGSDETGTNPNGLGAVHEGSGETTAIVDTTSGDDVDLLAGKRGDLALALVNDGGDEDRGGDGTSVATTLTTLSADDVNTLCESLVDVLGGTDHVHDEDAGLVEPLDDVLWWDTDGTDEELGLLLDNDVDQLVELTLGVVVVGLTGGAADLGDKEIDTEG